MSKNYRQVRNQAPDWVQRRFQRGWSFDRSNRARRKANRQRYRTKHLSWWVTPLRKLHSSRHFIDLHQQNYY